MKAYGWEWVDFLVHWIYPQSPYFDPTQSRRHARLQAFAFPNVNDPTSNNNFPLVIMNRRRTPN